MVILIHGVVEDSAVDQVRFLQLFHLILLAMKAGKEQETLCISEKENHSLEFCNQPNIDTRMSILHWRN